MNCTEYIKSFTASVHAEAESLQVPIVEAFFDSVGGILVESEAISTYTLGYFIKKIGTSFAEINGYSYELADGTFNIFIVDDMDFPEENLTNTSLNRMLGRVETFIKAAIETRFFDWEESSSGYEIASNIYRLYQNRQSRENEIDLKKFHIYVLTNKILSKRFINQQREKISDIVVDFSVYDATRLFDIAKSGFQKEPVNIRFSDFNYNGIYGIKSTAKENEFESYLATIPGSVLADIYLKHGTQILEGNVRAFLSLRGKVNKGIRKTILETPEKFFILNNGITVTSRSIEYVSTKKGLLIKQINDMQIVNGGQTTASLANILIKEKADLSRIQVMMKLSVLADNDIAIRLVPEISRASNSQNKIDEADFFSNHPYHVKIEELSKRNLAPAINGNQYQTEWFYERARGQYTAEQMKLTATQTKTWQLKHPKNQVIKKTDLAKYMLSYDGYPHFVSKGAQMAMKKFSTFIQGPNGDDGIWSKKPAEINSKYFKELVAKAILFKETEKLVSSYSWYKEVKAYRANIVTYTIAILEYYSGLQKKNLNLNKIWLEQCLYESLISQISSTSKLVYDFLIRDDRGTQNVTEWAKKDECWKRMKDRKYMDLIILSEFDRDLVDEVRAKTSEVTEAVVDSMEFVIDKNFEFWERAKKWGDQFLYLTPKDRMYLELAERIFTQKKFPSDKQFKEIVKVYNMLVSKGYSENEKT
ncbi:AIPR family protein [uncultured Enterococcus sp.]|uniref:AIPR family protein n=1 Tax=uncultured Enterococcus sp. TaxID=167972 RepID=UPI002AA61AA3|nr:AIPR family protein [uncultured Enterococcus sp.]